VHFCHGAVNQHFARRWVAWRRSAALALTVLPVNSARAGMPATGVTSTERRALLRALGTSTVQPVCRASCATALYSRWWLGATAMVTAPSSAARKATRLTNAPRRIDSCTSGRVLAEHAIPELPSMAGRCDHPLRLAQRPRHAVQWSRYVRQWAVSLRRSGAAVLLGFDQGFELC